MDFSRALDRAREHSAVVQRMEFNLRADPQNDRLALGLGSARRRAQRSNEELEAFAASSQVDLIRYRIQHDADIYAVEAVAESVHAFQKSFTGAADFIESGQKARARFSHDIEDRTRLNLAYTVPGSLCLVLAIENKRDLFDDARLDGVFDVFQQFVEVSDEDAAVDASRSLGQAVITQFCRWADVNAKWETSVDYVVKRSNGIHRGEHVSKNTFFDLSDIFNRAKDEEPHEFDASGTLIGLDLELRNFHFVVPDGESYRGKLADDFGASPTTVGARYRVYMTENIVRSVASGNETRSYVLKSLHEDG